MAHLAAGTKYMTDRQPQDRREAVPLPWREGLWPLDWLSLRLSPVYYGIGVPRGDGSAVIVVPGFMGTDLYLSELYFWLHRIGYKPYMSGIGVNAECPGLLTQRLLETMERAHTESGGPVRLIGHSLGGLIARGACLQRPGLAAQLIYLGSPVRSLEAHPVTLATVAVVRMAVRLRALTGGGRCLTERCDCGFGQALARPLPASIQRAAVYSRKDGVVDWHDTVERDPRLNHEVGGTHLGLVVNPGAYRVMAELLADPGSGGSPACGRSA